MEDSAAKQESREHFRIGAELKLNAYPIAEGTSLADISDEFVKQHLFAHSERKIYSILERYRSVEQTAAPLLHDIQKSNPKIGRYLNLLEKKFELITEALSTSEHDNQQKINLGGGGVSFAWKERFAPEQNLIMKISLTSPFDYILSIGKVMDRRQSAIMPSASHPYVHAVQFTELSEKDDKRLNQFVLQRQAEQLREQRG